MDEIKIYQIRDLMDILGIGRDRAYALMRSQQFPSTKIGKMYFVTKDNFEKWLELYAYKEFAF